MTSHAGGPVAVAGVIANAYLIVAALLWLYFARPESISLGDSISPIPIQPMKVFYVIVGAIGAGILWVAGLELYARLIGVPAARKREAALDFRLPGVADDCRVELDRTV